MCCDDPSLLLPERCQFLSWFKNRRPIGKAYRSPSDLAVADIADEIITWLYYTCFDVLSDQLESGYKRDFVKPGIYVSVLTGHQKPGTFKPARLSSDQRVSDPIYRSE